MNTYDGMKSKASLENHETSGGFQVCPGCGNRTKSIFYRYRYTDCESFIYRCDRCSLEFLRPLVLAEVNERRMESVDDAEMFHSPLLRCLHEWLIIRPEITRVRNLLGRNDFSMLDVGCGTGWISRIWADSGARVTGLEPSEARAALARERGLRVLSCYAEELESNERFNLIVIRHVIEHLEDPAAILRNLATQLTPEGFLLVITPNIDCIGRRVFDDDWTWVLLWHCNFFNPHSLGMLLNTCDYTIAEIYQTPSPLWYPESFRRRYPRLEKLVSDGAVFCPFDRIWLCQWME